MYDGPFQLGLGKRFAYESDELFDSDDVAPITLMTDASDYGIGGYSYQEVDGVKQLVALVLANPPLGTVDSIALCET